MLGTRIEYIPGFFPPNGHFSATNTRIAFGHRSTADVVLKAGWIDMVFIRPLGWSQDLGHLKRSRIPANDEMATLKLWIMALKNFFSVKTIFGGPTTSSAYNLKKGNY